VAANPFYIDPTGGIDPTSGLRGISEVLGEIGAKREKEAQVKNAEDRFNAAKNAAMAAYQSGDPDKVAQVAIEYPEIAEAASMAIGHRDEQTKKAKMDAYRRALINPSGASAALTEGIKVIDGMGGKPDNMMNTLGMMQADPEAAQNMIAMEYATLDPKGWEAIKEQSGYIDPAKARELNIKQETLNVRKQENDLRKSEQALKEEENELKREKLQLEINEKEQKIQSKKKELETASKGAITSINKGIESVNRLLEHPGLRSAVGASSVFPTMPGTAKASFEAELESFDAQGFLAAVKQMVGMGQLSDAEGRKLSASIGALDPKMREEDFVASLERIREGFQESLGGMLPDTTESTRLQELRQKAGL